MAGRIYAVDAVALSHSWSANLVPVLTRSTSSPVAGAQFNRPRLLTVLTLCLPTDTSVTLPHHRHFNNITAHKTGLKLPVRSSAQPFSGFFYRWTCQPYQSISYEFQFCYSPNFQDYSRTSRYFSRLFLTGHHLNLERNSSFLTNKAHKNRNASNVHNLEKKRTHALQGVPIIKNPLGKKSISPQL